MTTHSFSSETIGQKQQKVAELRYRRKSDSFPHELCNFQSRNGQKPQIESSFRPMEQDIPDWQQLQEGGRGNGLPSSTCRIPYSLLFLHSKSSNSFKKQRKMNVNHTSRITTKWPGKITRWWTLGPTTSPAEPRKVAPGQHRNQSNTESRLPPTASQMGLLHSSGLQLGDSAAQCSLLLWIKTGKLEFRCVLTTGSNVDWELRTVKKKKPKTFQLCIICNSIW